MSDRQGLVHRLVLAGITAGMAFSVIAAPPDGIGQEKAAEFNRGVFDREAASERRRVYHDWLDSERVAVGQDKKLSAPVSVQEMAAIDNERGVLPVRVGLAKSLAAEISFKDVRAARLKGRSLSRTHGAMAGTADGGYVYTAELGSAQATALRVHFKNFNLPAKAGVFLYNEFGQVFGPYTRRGPHGSGEFWSHTIMGDSITLQLRHLGPVTDQDLHSTRFRIAGLGHLRPRFMGGQCTNNESCTEIASCVNASSVVNGAKLAVAHMQWPQGAFFYICSGGLIADMDSSYNRPLFLSANHCLNKNSTARNLENFFQYELPNSDCGNSPNCGDIFALQVNHPQHLRTLGATVLATGKSTDYTLLELSEQAPAGSAFLGWNSAPVAFSNGINLFRISHPDGSPQAYSTHDVDVNAGTCRSWPRGNRIYSRDTFGATEGGSSGSPVVNSDGEIVGQLSGACGTNVNETCDSESNATVDGAFAAYFSQVQSILDPDPGTCTPQPEICGDGIDNDCDDVIDEPECQEPPGGQPGDTCMEDAECESNKCKGKPDNQTCR